MGVPAEAAPGSRVLSALHQVDEPGEGCLQAGGLQGGLPTMGNAQEQAGHELRDDGQGAEVLLPARHPGQGGWPAAGLSVCGCAQGYRGDRLQWCLSGSRIRRRRRPVNIKDQWVKDQKEKVALQGNNWDGDWSKQPASGNSGFHKPREGGI